MRIAKGHASTMIVVVVIIIIKSRFWYNFIAFSIPLLVVWKHNKYLLTLKLAITLEIISPFLFLVSCLQNKDGRFIYLPSAFNHRHSTHLWREPLFFLPTFSNHKKLSFIWLLLKIQLPEKARSCRLGCYLNLCQVTETLLKIIFLLIHHVNMELAIFNTCSAQPSYSLLRVCHELQSRI